MTLILGLLLKKTIGVRISTDDEVAGIDLSQHAESGYELGAAGGGGHFAGIGQSAALRATKEEVNA